MARGPLAACLALLLLAAAQALRVDPPAGLERKLVPDTDAHFYKKDYPHDHNPSSKVNFQSPFPVVQDSSSFDKDYTKDENSDDGEWKAQNEYDSLRLKLSKAKEEQERAESKEAEEKQELEEAEAEHEEAVAKAKEERRARAAEEKAAEAAAKDDAALDKAVEKARAEVKRQEKKAKECEEELAAEKARLKKAEAERKDKEEGEDKEAEDAKTVEAFEPEHVAVPKGPSAADVQEKEAEYHSALKSYETEAEELRKVEAQFEEAKKALKRHRLGKHAPKPVEKASAEKTSAHLVGVAVLLALVVR